MLLQQWRVFLVQWHAMAPLWEHKQEKQKYAKLSWPEALSNLGVPHKRHSI